MAIRDPQQEHIRSGGGGGLAFGLMFVGVIAFLALASVTSRIGPASIPIWFAVMGGAAYALRGPLGQAMATRISGHALQGDQAELPPEIYAELDELRARVGELEERVDFSERLLTAAKEEQQKR